MQQVIREMDMVEKVVREACARSPDGTISPADFSSHASRSMRYGTFSPMEVSIIFHFAAGAEGKARLGLKDFAQLLDPKWGPPPKASSKVKVVKGTFLHETAKVRFLSTTSRRRISRLT
jgi:solute carrier family 25 aspartate/glutamate transporter 12/13